MVEYRKRSFQKGFSLIDTLMVIMIIGILATTLTPQFHSILSEMKLNGATTELVSALEYTKSLATKYQRPFQLRSYRYDYGNDHKNSFLLKDYTSPLDSNIHPDADPPLFSYHRVFHPVDKTPYIIDFDDVQGDAIGVVEPRHEYEGVRILSVPGGGTDGSVYFYPDGHSSDTDSSFTLDLNGEQRTITVDGITGRISVS